MITKTYSKLKQFSTFEERFEYLKLDGRVGEETFGSKRYLNQILYKTDAWKSLRDKVILRDNGCDLGIEGREIYDKVLVHHINPITVEDVMQNDSKVFDMNNLICTTKRTHDAIHYGNAESISHVPIERKPNDTCPWRH